MLTLSATCVAIALADERGTLRLEERSGRFGAYVAISDETGLIEVTDNMDEATARVQALRDRRA